MPLGDFIANASDVLRPASDLGKVDFNVLMQISRGQHVPSREELPPVVDDFLKTLEGVSPTEKISLINGFVDSRIKFKEQENGSPEDTRPLSEIFEAGEGDCDDYAYAKAMMLNHAGFDEVYTAGVTVKYKFAQGSSADEPHAIAVVKNKDDGKLYVLDNLASKPYALDKSGLASEDSSIILPDNAENGPASMKITDIWGISRFDQSGRMEYFIKKPDPPDVEEEMNQKKVPANKFSM